MIKNEELFNQFLENIYDSFYSHLLADPYLRVFFKDKDVEDIKRRQIESLKEKYKKFIKGETEELKEYYKYLAKLHDEIGLDFNSYMESIGDLELLVIKEFLQNIRDLKDENLEEIFSNISNFFDFIRVYSAAGYLENFIKREYSLIRDFVNANIDKDIYEIKDFVDAHIAWEEKIMKYLIDEVPLTEIALSEKECDIGMWLSQLSKANSEEKTQGLANLLDLHNKLHQAANRIVELKKKTKFVQLIDEYNQFMKLNLLFLSSLISFISSMQIEKLQKDPLTGVLTRRLLKDIFTNIMDLSILSNEPFAVAFIDIDDFKKINDTYGHLVGDEVLKTVATVIRENLRSSDYIVRYGGEEFVLILPSIKSLDNLFNLLERLRKAFESTKVKISDDKYLTFTVSIGAVLVKEDKRVPVKEVLDFADKLMYKAKKTGKNKVVVDIFKVGNKEEVKEKQ